MNVSLWTNHSKQRSLQNDYNMFKFHFCGCLGMAEWSTRPVKKILCGLGSVFIHKSAITNCHKLGGLKTTEFSLIVLEERNTKLSFPQGHAPSEALGRILSCAFLASGGGLQSLQFLGLQLPRLCSHMAFSLCLCPNFPLLTRKAVKFN